jgi:hypothetical protein
VRSFTPGTWTWNEEAGEVLSDVDEDGLLVATVESNDADGPLIAAAPRLYALAKLILEFAYQNIPEGILREAAICAARAEGRAR